MKSHACRECALNTACVCVCVCPSAAWAWTRNCVHVLISCHSMQINPLIIFNAMAEPFITRATSKVPPSPNGLYWVQIVCRTAKAHNNKGENQANDGRKHTTIMLYVYVERIECTFYRRFRKKSIRFYSHTKHMRRSALHPAQGCSAFCCEYSWLMLNLQWHGFIWIACHRRRRCCCLTTFCTEYTSTPSCL